MKIDGQTGSQLLQRMQEMHQEATEATQKADGAARSEATFSVETAATEETSRAEETKTSLQTRIETEATRALSGEYADDAEVRGAVIEAIVDERLGDALGAAERRRMESTLKDALIDDPGFIEKVDDMLLLAARDLAGR